MTTPHEQIDERIQAAYDFMDSVVDDARQARAELAHFKSERDKMAHECARLSLVIARMKEQALAAPVKDSLTPEAAPMVRLTKDEVTALVREAAKGSALNRDGGTSQRIANAIMDAMIAKNGGK